MAKNYPRHIITDRTKAIKWWNSLSSLHKTQICDTHTELIGGIRRYETLTGREVEELYKSELKQQPKQ